MRHEPSINKATFNARIVDVETARVVLGRQVLCEECREQDFFDAIKMVSSTIAQ